jgi:hypothetical protein
MRLTISTPSTPPSPIPATPKSSNSDGLTPDLETEINGLRELICLYIADNVEVVSEHTSFMNLIEDGGAFVRDLWKRVVVAFCLSIVQTLSNFLNSVISKFCNIQIQIERNQR